MLAVLYSAGFIAAFNENIINVALIDIMNAFSVSSTTAQWLVTGYMIVTSIVVSVMAFLSRRFSLRRLILAGAGFLVVGSLGCFFAPTFALLLTFRLLQAVGTGIFIPSMMTTVLATAPKHKLGAFLSIGGCCITFGPALSPVVSGLMATVFGWRFVFATPAVAVLLVAVAATVFVRDLREPEKAKLDVLSVLFSALGLVGLVYGLTEITSSLVVGAVIGVIGLVFLGLFAFRQTKLEEPILNLAPFGVRNFAFACMLVIVAMMTTFSMSVILMLYFEGALGMSAFGAGLLLLLPILVNAATAVLGGRIMDKFGPWPLLPVGFAVITVGQAIIAATSANASLYLVVAGAVVTYGGVGLVFSPAQTSGLNSIERRDHASGVSIMNLLIQVAACLGPALFVGVLSSTAASEAAAGVDSALSQAHGFSAAVWVSAAVALVGAVVAFVFTRTYVVPEAEPERELAGDAARAERPFRVTELMERDVYVVRESATVGDAVSVFIEKKTSGLPVLNSSNKLVGFVSDGDVLRYLTGGEALAGSSSAALMLLMQEETMRARIPELLSVSVMELATRDVVSVSTGASFEDTCKLLSEKRVKKVPVLEGDRLVGTLSRSDLLRSFFAYQMATGNPR